MAAPLPSLLEFSLNFSLEVSSQHLYFSNEFNLKFLHFHLFMKKQTNFSFIHSTQVNPMWIRVQTPSLAHGMLCPRHVLDSYVSDL